MENTIAELDPTELTTDPRPSEDFVRAVAQLLQTDAEDLLTELGYVPEQAVVTAGG
jgi:hypothetical protein